MARFPIALIAAAMLVLPTTAGAARTRTPHSAVTASQRALDKLALDGPVALATAVAESYWHAVPCAGEIAVLTDLPVPSSLEPTTDGWVTFDSSLGENDLEAPASSYTRCTISLAAWQWPTQRTMVNDWNMFCLTVTHEVGHLLGHKHSLVPGSVMAPVFTSEANVPRICLSTRVHGGSAPTRRSSR